MQAQLTKWGNSVAIRLPKALLEAAKLKPGPGGTRSQAHRRHLVRAKRRCPNIDGLVAQITDENRHPETVWSLARGDEFW